MSDWHDPAQREAAGMGADHDRQILEAAEKYGRPDVVVVRCPHTIGLCYDDAKHGMLANLPCPCNDRSEIVARIVPVDVEQDETTDPYVADRIEQIRRTALRVKPIDVGVFKAMLPTSVADLMAIAPADLAWLCALAAPPVSPGEPEGRPEGSICDREHGGRHYYSLDGTCQRCGHDSTSEGQPEGSEQAALLDAFAAAVDRAREARRAAPAPVPDDEAERPGDLYRDAAASLRKSEIHWPADCLMQAADLIDAYAQAVREAERATAERIAEAIETVRDETSTPGQPRWAAFGRAARIARDLTRETVEKK